jgi:ABC-2 type transport system ATP-binding protein
MIKVDKLTKRYPARTAVNEISFEIQPGEIVGFLGPNGAGKTTAMRMLAGALVMSSGRAEVAGFDVFKQSMEVRRRVGYLPENCPLYPELRVDEYLRFRAELKGVPRARRRARILQVKELCGLAEVGTRIIGQLSKGYRQRVGLAEALLHDPDLLILDEPTVGLDPNQIRQVRALIKGLAPRHTILLSTHILQEVEAVCERVLIIKNGRIAAADRTEALSERVFEGVRVRAELRAAEAQLRPWLEPLEPVQQLHFDPLEDGWTAVELAARSDVRETLYALAVRQELGLRELHAEKISLEESFAYLTRGEDE